MDQFQVFITTCIIINTVGKIKRSELREEYEKYFETKKSINNFYKFLKENNYNLTKTHLIGYSFKPTSVAVVEKKKLVLNSAKMIEKEYDAKIENLEKKYKDYVKRYDYECSFENSVAKDECYINFINCKNELKIECLNAKKEFLVKKTTNIQRILMIQNETINNIKLIEAITIKTIKDIKANTNQCSTTFREIDIFIYI
jgi:hypothetical protein